MSTAMVKKRAPRKRVAKPRMYARARGRGDYTMDKPGPWGKYGRAIGAQLGGHLLGPYLGPGLAQGLGGKIGSYAHYIGKIFGSGDYITAADKVKYNVLVNDSQVPQFGSSKNIVHVKHREFLGDIITASVANTFQIQSFNINPGLVASFPWLSQVCGASFQQYRINGMVFEYRTMSADALNSTNTALGSVVMATDYDSADAAFTTKAQMENTEFGVSCKPSQCMIHAIECARSQTSVSEQYVRAGAVPAGADIRLYDLGKFYIATSGFQGTNVNVGELWVSYDITFFKAIQQPPGYLIPTAHYQMDQAQWPDAKTAVLAANTGNDTIGLTFDPINGRVFWPLTIPLNSVWLVQLSAIGTATAGAGTLASTAANGMTTKAIYALDVSSAFQYPSTVPSATEVSQAVFQVVKYTGGATAAALPRVTFTFTGGIALSAYSSVDLVVTMINGNVS